MREQNMPARIWCDDIDVSLCNRALSTFGRTSYTRSDIAERMAEALADMIGHAKFVAVNFDVHYMHLEKCESALSAFRSATQDTEARHE